MANNSGNTNTANQLAFGQFGSTLLTGDGAAIDLTGSGATRYVSAITVVGTTAATFEVLENMDGAVGSISTVTAENDLDGADGIGAQGNGTALTNSNTSFPVGITIYGKWDKVEMNAGDVICYFAPRTVNNV